MSQTHAVEVKAGIIIIDAIPDRKLIRFDISGIATEVRDGDCCLFLTRDQVDILIRALQDTRDELEG